MLIGVYGTLKKGKHNNKHFLGNSKFIRKDVVGGFRLYTSGIPFAYEDKDSPYKIHIDIYKVNDKETLNRLDRLEGHPDAYERKPFNVSGDEVWIYTYNHDHVKGKAELTNGNF